MAILRYKIIAANFLVVIVVVFKSLFYINSLVIAGVSSKKIRR